MDHYAAVSEQIREIFLRHTPLVEPLSLDEAFLDVTGTEGLFGPPVEVARRIKRAILSEVGLVASVGVAPNKFLAKVASDLQKPDALVVVDPDNVQAFLDPLPVGRIWGVGRVTGAALEQRGIRTVADLRRMGPEALQRHFGEHGDHFWKLAHGIDDRRVVPDREAKSISHETTFATDLYDREPLRAWLLELTEHVGRRVRRHGLHGRTVQIKVRFADFRTITRAETLPQATDSTQTIWETAANLLETCLPAERTGIRLLGVGLSRFENASSVQRSLFEEPELQKRTQLDAVTDQIQARFGGTSLSRGSGLLHQVEHRPMPRPESNADHSSSSDGPPQR
jgi:DNA polymerase-4